MKKVLASLLLISAVLTLPIIPVWSADAPVISWTSDELAFMEAHPVIRLGVDPGFVPFEFFDEQGQYVGIVADYLALISERTGLSFDVVKDLTWPEAYDMALAGHVDALPAVGKTAEREDHFLYSDPYYHFKRVIVTREDDTEISSLEDLEGFAVAVQRNSSHHSYLVSYPKINLSLYDSVEAALTAVATGEEHAFLGNLATTNYLVRSNAIPHLRFVSFEAEKPQALHFAIRPDWPELVDIFNAALATITESEKLAIHQKWVVLSPDSIDFRPLIRVIVIIACVTAIVMAVSFYWIVKLRREIQQRIIVQQDLERAKRAADEASEFKSSFVARMSHEIRTPLNAITGMAYLLKKTHLTLTQRIYADRITQASSSMLNIVDDILDYSKIEAGKVELEMASFNMDQVLQDVVNIVSYKVEEQQIGFSLSKDPLLPSWFIGDSKRIGQVLLNVLNNAVKFTDKGEVSLDIRLLSREKDTYNLAFTVKDTGIGMDEDQVQRLFNPFTQADSSINRRFGGSGLGLSIVKNLVDLMEGQIEVCSAPGEGSTFVIHLSLNVDEEKERVYAETLSGNPLRNVKTLVLEKDESCLRLLESYLHAFGMHCELATSRANAMNMLETANREPGAPFDLLIVDYDPPSGGGFKFVEAVMLNEKISRKPEFMMLLPAMREDLFEKLDQYGVKSGIGKPVIPSVLLNALLDIFDLEAVAAAHDNEMEGTEPINPDRIYTVLVVEDNKTNQLISQNLLQLVGIKSLLASDGQEAVALYKQHQEEIALILMDLHMPVMNGYEAATAIRELSSNVPIVAMTADVVLGVKEKCAASGMYHYISKPFDPNQFIQTVRRLILENEPYIVAEPRILDVDAGIRNMGGNPDIYRKVLIEYLHENRDTRDKLSLAMRQKRFADAAQIVHKTKSSSGSIGAKTLYDVSLKFQKALDERDEGQIAVLAQEFSRLLDRLLDEIAQDYRKEKPRD